MAYDLSRRVRQRPRAATTTATTTATATASTAAATASWSLAAKEASECLLCSVIGHGLGRRRAQPIEAPAILAAEHAAVRDLHSSIARV
eukprot:scaffold109116_cov66-Phaeocystis_antarctica.AAC.6